MTKVLVLYYSAYGHIETDGQRRRRRRARGGRRGRDQARARTGPGRSRREVPLQDGPAGPDRRAVDELADYDAIIVGTRHALRHHGRADAQFLGPDRRPVGAGQAGRQGRLGVHLVAPRSTAARRSTILGFIPTLLHQGMVVVGLPYAFAGQMGVDEIKGGSPYGATTIAGGDGSRQPSERELARRPLPGQARRRHRRQAQGLNGLHCSEFRKPRFERTGASCCSRSAVSA